MSFLSPPFPPSFPHSLAGSPAPVVLFLYRFPLIEAALFAVAALSDEVGGDGAASPDFVCLGSCCSDADRFCQIGVSFPGSFSPTQLGLLEGLDTFGFSLGCWCCSQKL